MNIFKRGYSRRMLVMSLVCGVAAIFQPLLAEDRPEKVAFLTAESAGADFQIQGEYEGKGAQGSLGAQVIALGKGEFDAVIYAGGLPGAGWDGTTKSAAHGKTENGKTVFTGEGISGTIADQHFKGMQGGEFDLKWVKRESPTMGAKPPEGAVVLFDGSNVDHWEGGKLEEGGLLNVGVRSKEKFRNFTLHLEFRTPFMPAARGQGRGNSGVYLLDQYECQVLDSFGLTGENNECGGFYKVAKPSVNMCLPPLSWQTYDIDFTAARYVNSKKTGDAIAHVRLNGVLIHDQLNLPNNTPGGGLNDESQAGALFLQNHGDPVRFRNIWVVENK